MLLYHIIHDARSTTGKNLLLQTEKDSVEDLCKSDSRSINYHPIEKEEEWKVGLLNNPVDIRDWRQHLEGFSDDEVSCRINFMCTS